MCWVGGSGAGLSRRRSDFVKRWKGKEISCIGMHRCQIGRWQFRRQLGAVGMSYYRLQIFCVYGLILNNVNI